MQKVSPPGVQHLVRVAVSDRTPTLTVQVVSSGKENREIVYQPSLVPRLVEEPGYEATKHLLI